MAYQQGSERGFRSVILDLGLLYYSFSSFCLKEIVTLGGVAVNARGLCTQCVHNVV